MLYASSSQNVLESFQDLSLNIKAHRLVVTNKKTNKSISFPAPTISPRRFLIRVQNAYLLASHTSPKTYLSTLSDTPSSLALSSYTLALRQGELLNSVLTPNA